MFIKSVLCRPISNLVVDQRGRSPEADTPSSLTLRLCRRLPFSPLIIKVSRTVSKGLAAAFSSLIPPSWNFSRHCTYPFVTFVIQPSKAEKFEAMVARIGFCLDLKCVLSKCNL